MTTPLPRELCHVLSVVCSLPNDSLQDFAHFLQEAFDGFALRVRRQLVRQQSNMAGPTPAQLARLAQFANASQTFFKSFVFESPRGMPTLTSKNLLIAPSNLLKCVSRKSEHALCSQTRFGAGF